MSHPHINANVIQSDGEYYRVKLISVPNVGDNIELTSLHNIATGHADKMAKSYKVKKIVHKMHDITDAFPNGVHEVEIHV